MRLSAEHGVWATSRSNERKLNEAFASTEHVLLIFSVNESQHFQVCAPPHAGTGVCSLCSLETSLLGASCLLHVALAPVETATSAAPPGIRMPGGHPAWTRGIGKGL